MCGRDFYSTRECFSGYFGGTFCDHCVDIVVAAISSVFVGSRRVIMTSAAQEFAEDPSEGAFHLLTKDQLIEVAAIFKIELTSAEKRLKHTVKSVILPFLVEERVLPSVDMRETIQLKELAIKEKELDNQREELRLKMALNELELKRLEIRAKEENLDMAPTGSFDASRHIRLVPPFVEKDVEKYFPHFEKVALTLRWPREVWPLLIQSVLTGRAQEVYSALSMEQSSNYDVVKAAILRSYQLVPEAYRQRFRQSSKTDRQSYIEFAREKETLFDRWCAAKEVDSRAKLRELILLEEFKNCLPGAVSTYLSERQVDTLHEAAVLADEFALTHHVYSRDQPRPDRPQFRREIPQRLRSSVSPEPACFYCKKRGHLVAECPVLERKQAANMVTVIKATPRTMTESTSDSESGYEPFLSDGFVSLPGGQHRTPVRILRDTGASLSFILQGVLPLSGESEIGTSVLVRGFEMGSTIVPLHQIELKSNVLTGSVAVGVRRSLPVPGVTFILGNDIGGGNVWSRGNSEVFPQVAEPMEPMIHECAQKYPDVFPACAVTRAMARGNSSKRRAADSDSVGELSDSFFVTLDESVVPKSFPSVPPTRSDREASKAGKESGRFTRENLVAAQKADMSLTCLFQAASCDVDLNQEPQCFFVRDGILMRKWRPNSVPDQGNSVHQIVVPSVYREEILRVAHDGLAGHLGIAKTLNRINQHFFWPGAKRDVVCFCKSCCVCQLAGKPNQTIPPAPLYPIPVMGQPFDHVIIDIVGPLVRSTSGYRYLLTIMCAATRFPEAIPLRKITTKVVLRELLGFFSMFGLPKIVQTDRGSNFMSRVFARALKQLRIQHNVSSAYHPESQGALERYHQTLKGMLRTYCLESGRDWADAVPWLLFASREVTQESLGFSPADLVFGHTPRGPLAVLKDQFLSESPVKDVCSHVTNFRSRLHRALELARENLGRAQGKMKNWYDRKAVSRHFEVGEKVLMLLPIPGSALQARFSGPYVVEDKVSDRDYVIATPDRRQQRRLCHVNMLKPYFERVPIPACSPVSDTLPSTDGTVMLSVLVEESENAESCPSRAVVEGRLNNTETLSVLPERLPHLSDSQRADVLDIIHQFPELFSDVPKQTHVIEHDIDVGTAAPIKQHPYRVNPVKRAVLRKEVEYMLLNDIAEPSMSPWSSPCLLVAKADGTFRFCTDYRRVNAVTKPDCYPLPRMDDCIDRVGSAVFVSKFDLLKGYWQIPLTSRAKEISAFVTPDDFLCYRVMAFGMRNAPATFQRLINTVLTGMPGCEAYLDDVVLFSATWSEHIDQVRELFCRLSAARLTINLAKCDFGKATVTYLGRVVGGGQVRPLDAKVSAICNFPAPADRRELRRFLGMVGYYRSFCKNFSAVVAPLSDLLSPKVLYQWSEQCRKAFENVKALLVSAPVLAAPDFSKLFFLAVDASDQGAGAVLLQSGAEEVQHPVCYFSRKFNDQQRRYSTIEKETLALVLAVQHFEVYLGALEKVVVYSDHDPLRFLFRMRNANQRLMRWSLILQPFNIEIKHVRGTDNVLADALSRVP